MQVVKNGRTILVGEDDLELRGYLQMALKCLGYSAMLAQDGDEVISCLESARSEIVAILIDIRMPNRDGFETLSEIRRIDQDVPVIIISGLASPMNVVTAMKAGATDFLSKPVGHEDLRKAIARALDNRGVEYPPYPSTSRNSLSDPKTFTGRNPRMRELYSVIGQIGASEAPVLILGETGSGKEVIARELHAHSPRAKRIFLKLNCAALPSELVESELFGYERGAFTGAYQRKAGMFETADGGAIFLDEIGDMDIRLQSKLLQVLQDREFQRIAGKETIKVDVRVIAATHRDLEKGIVDGTFREDLYYRLNVVNVALPPLRDRPEDIVPLAEFLMKKHAEPGVALPPFTVELKHAIMTHHWPGNVRELENFVRRFLIFRDPDRVARELHAKAALKPLLTGALAQTNAAPAAQPQSGPILEQVSRAKEQAEADLILAALNATRWNRKRVAALLKIDYKALLYKMKKLGLGEKPPESASPHLTVGANG